MKKIFLFSIVILTACSQSTPATTPIKIEPLKTGVYDFKSCVAAGNPVARSYPAQCHTKDGQVFVDRN